MFMKLFTGVQTVTWRSAKLLPWKRFSKQVNVLVLNLRCSKSYHILRHWPEYYWTQHWTQLWLHKRLHKRLQVAERFAQKCKLPYLQNWLVQHCKQLVELCTSFPLFMDHPKAVGIVHKPRLILTLIKPEKLCYLSVAANQLCCDLVSLYRNFYKSTVYLVFCVYAKTAEWSRKFG